MASNLFSAEEDIDSDASEELSLKTMKVWMVTKK